MELEDHLSETSNKKTDLLNNLLTEKIGYGYAQQKFSRSLYLLLFSEGCQSIVLGLLLPVLTEEWNLTTFKQSMLITTVYFGVAMGSYLQVYSDRFGRYTFITWDAALQCFFGLFSCICWSYESFLFTRFFYGIGIGICLPLSASYITEISPSYMRATLLAKSRLYWSGGCLVTCLLGYYFLQDNSWRTLLFMICLPGIYALYEHKVDGKESLRYLWVQKRVDEVVEVTNAMCQLNNKPEISRSEIEMLIAEDAGDTEAVDVPLSEMFNRKYKPSTIRLMSSWFTVCFIYYGVMLLLPTILQRVFTKAQSNENFKYLFLIAISMVEVAAFYMSSMVMDHPKIGRKKSVYYGLTIVLVVTCLILIFGEDNKPVLFIIFAIIKFVISSTFMTLFPYTAQIYETMIRGKALGICSVSGRIATTLLGLVGVYAIKWWDGNGLYIIFIILCAISGYGAFTMPYCTSGNRPIG